MSLVFENTDGSTMHLTRSIVGSGDSEHRSYSSEYSIGKKRVSLEVFAAQLLELGINTKARNFLVFQVCHCLASLLGHVRSPSLGWNSHACPRSGSSPYLARHIVMRSPHSLCSFACKLAAFLYSRRHQQMQKAAGTPRCTLVPHGSMLGRCNSDLPTSSGWTPVCLQGDIEKVAQQSPEELRVFFELISGSDALKGDYSSCEDDVNECERKSGVLHTKKQAVTKRKSSLEEAKREAEKYQKETRALVRCLALCWW